MRSITSLTKLNLGCGLKPIEDHVNVDVVESIKPDIVHDLNIVPYPFPDNRFDEVRAWDVIEHVADLPTMMREIWRIAKPGCMVEFTTPHFSCDNSYTDPTHVRHLSSRSLRYFEKGHPFCFYGNDGFQVLKADIIFRPSLLNKVIHRIARRHPLWYEERLAWMFPAWYLWFQLRVCKDSHAFRP
jgi:SAM-dependent methyltransferase